MARPTFTAGMEALAEGLDRAIGGALAGDSVGAWRSTIMELAARDQGATLFEVGGLSGAAGTTVLLGGPNVVLWTDLSLDVVSAIIELRVEGLLRTVPCDPVAYVAEGGVLKLPLVRSVSTLARGYRHPHWLPVLLVAGETPKTP